MKPVVWLVVEPTHLKNMLVKLEIFPNFRGENKKYLKPPPRVVHYVQISQYLLLNSFLQVIGSEMPFAVDLLSFKNNPLVISPLKKTKKTVSLFRQGAA